MSNPWDYDLWPGRQHIGWGPGAYRGDSMYDNIDFHVDLGCGNRPKGRIGVDRYAAPGVAIVADLDNEWGGLVRSVAERPGEDAPAPSAALSSGSLIQRGLPFSDSSIKSIISHHFFEHVGIGFMALIDEVYRVLEPGGILRAITPLFPSTAAVEDPDHCRYFMAHDGGGGTWDAFCGTPEAIWMEEFSVPYTKARFEKVDQDLTPRIEDVREWWGPHDQRELRVALKVVK